MDVYDRYLLFAEQHGAISVGKSLFGRDIFAFFVGDSAKSPVLLQGGIHAREWITSSLLLETYRRLSLRDHPGGVWILPMINPDGVLLATRGISSVPKRYRSLLLSVNPSGDFSLWKANGRAVDLNVNFDAGYGSGRLNCFSPAAENYIGKYAHSEPCVRALAEFTRRVRPRATFSFHTKGQVVYWHFPQKRGFSGSKRLGKKLFRGTGLPLRKSPGSAGGYKDWCTARLGIPAYTLELGREEWQHPLTEARLPELLQTTDRLLGRITEVFYAEKRE